VLEGLQHDGVAKAKPEWAKGAPLIRFTPRYNPGVNGYCIVRHRPFQYHWVAGDAPSPLPLLRQASGLADQIDWAAPSPGARAAAAGR